MQFELQICAKHKRTDKIKDRMFRPDQGKFLTDPKTGTVFVCYGCLTALAQGQAKRLLRRRSPSEFNVYHEFTRAGINYTPNYRLGKWPFDMAFPELKLFIEIDDPTHDTEQGAKRDFYKTKLAEEHGWTVKRLRKGIGLAARCAELLRQHREAIGA